jgi:hypothetical protein
VLRGPVHSPGACPGGPGSARPAAAAGTPAGPTGARPSGRAWPAPACREGRSQRAAGGWGAPRGRHAPGGGDPGGHRAPGRAGRAWALAASGLARGTHPRLPGCAILRFGSASCRTGVSWWVAGTDLLPLERGQRPAGPGAARSTPPAEVCGERTWARFAQAVSKHNRNSSLTSRAFKLYPLLVKSCTARAAAAGERVNPWADGHSCRATAPPPATAGAAGHRGAKTRGFKAALAQTAKSLSCRWGRKGMLGNKLRKPLLGWDSVRGPSFYP